MPVPMRTLWVVWVVLAAVIALLVGGAVGVIGGRRLRRPPLPEPPSEVPATPVLTSDATDLLAALRSVPVVVDRSDKVIYSPPRAAALGIVRGTELVHEQLLTLVRRVRRDDDACDAELELSRGPLGAGKLDLAVRISPLGSAYIVLLIDDQTQSRRVEETRRDFVVNVSHELKTPVAGLTLLAEAVDDARDDPEAVHRFSGRMKVEATRLSRLVQEIVQLSRLQVGDTLDEPVLVDVRACVREAVGDLSFIAGNKDITVTSALGDPAVLADVWGDPNLITTAVRNLVENAINYSEEHTKIAVIVTPSASDLIKVVVKDQGSGIPAAELDRIFERFYRVDAARSRRTGGTGLGLAIVKHIAANHGGDVRVWSEPGHGSTFTITLPAAGPAAERTPNEPDRTTLPAAQSTRKVHS